MRTRIYPYNAYSKSAKELSRSLGALRIKRNNSQFRPRRSDRIVNWGCSSFEGLPDPDGSYVLNHPFAVARVTNKLQFFNSYHRTGRLPDYWTDSADIPEDAYPIVCRTKLTGHSGQGVVIADSPDELVPALLYTQYIKKKDEYRVHVLGDEVIVNRKARSRDHSNPDWRIRTHNNGFIYERAPENVPQDVIDAARQVFSATKLDFGAVDVIWNEKSQKAYVLEVNTAPGLHGEMGERYAAAISSL